MWPEIESAKTENKRELKLSGVQISERIDANGLDQTIFQLNAINLLTISETSLKIVPSEISNLTNLQTLLLYGNEIKSLPNSIGLLDKLKVLDVSRNQLDSIPSEIANLTQLTTINLSNNALEQFPSLPNSVKLSVIDLSNNKLNAFPDVCHENNAVLADFLIKGNLIEEIPSELIHLVSLKHLSLANNKIKTVPKLLADMAKLKGMHFIYRSCCEPLHNVWQYGVFMIMVLFVCFISFFFAELDLSENPIADKRLLKLIQQCRTKQVVDYVKQHGAETKKAVSSSDQSNKSKKSKKSKNSVQNVVPQNKILVQRLNDDTVKVFIL